MKTCTKCDQDLPLESFANSGRNSRCKKCANALSRKAYAQNLERERTRRRAYIKANTEQIRQRAKDRYDADPQKARDIRNRWTARNRGKSNAASLRWNRENLERMKQNVRAWQLKNPAKVCASSANRRARKALVSITPNDPRIDKLYELAAHLRHEGFDVEVDHIIPLTPREGECQGLHVFANLQIISSSANRIKGNRQ